ncbi:MAG: AraC family transcriptional regulator [Pseudomonadota bacterium]
MKQQATQHRAYVFGSPWAGVYGTHLDSGRHFGRHWHAVFGVGLLEDGAQRSASGRGTVEAFAGDLITTNPGEVHDGQPLGGASRRWRMLYIDPAVMASMTGHPQAIHLPGVELTQPVFQDAALRQVLHRLLTQVERWDAGLHATTADALACEESLVAVCGWLQAQHAGAAPLVVADAGVRQVRERLADDPLQPPTLTELAVLAGVSKFQLLRRFEKTYGLTPFAWLLQQRTELARRQIRAGASLADAATDSGFADQSHMTRIFARQFGFTPGALQQASSSCSRAD